MRRWLVFWLLSVTILVPRRAWADADAAADAAMDADCIVDPSCPVDLSELEALDSAEGAAESTPDAAAQAPALAATGRLLFFWGVGCPRCEEAEVFLSKLQREFPALTIERIEVRKDAAGRRRFVATLRRLGARTAGVPTVVVGQAYVVGFVKGSTDREIRDLARRAARGEEVVASEKVKLVQLPGFGAVDPGSLSLPAFTLVVGLVDGINPCAMWVLLVLLGILAHVKSRKRLLLFGGTFVVASGVVYFMFMTAWVSLFSLVGLSRYVTILLGLLVLGMGLVNLKELIWFKQGVSLMIPDKAKPGLFRRMRRVAGAASLPAAFLGIAVLAFLVNLIELGCTLGLPAIYTRILTLRADLSATARLGYLALYNLAYVVPLALIVGAYALTLHRIKLSERGAKILKGVSGTLLVVFGLLFLVAPEMLT